MRFVSKKDVKKDVKTALSGLFVLMLTGVGFGFASTATADESAANLEFIMVSDDIRKTMTETARPEGTVASPAGNNGHGNNLDGVDSSNPGEGDGGPNGAVDESGDFDDEGGGGSASPSLEETNSGKSGK